MRLIFLVFFLAWWGGGIAGILTFRSIITKTNQKLRDTDQERSNLILKKHVLLAVWGVLSLIMLFLIFWMLLAVNHVEPDATLDSEDYFQLKMISGFTILYACIGWIISRWMRR